MMRSQKKSHLSMHFFSSHIEYRVCALRIRGCDDEYVFEWKDKPTKTRHSSTSFHRRGCLPRARRREAR